MTLHWWMHWFWVTLWFTVVVTGIPLPSKIGGVTTRTTIEEDKKIGDYATTTSESFSAENDDLFSASPTSSSSSLSSSSLRQNSRVPKAIGINSPLAPPEGIEIPKAGGQSPSNITKNDDYRVDRDAKIDQSSVLKLEDGIVAPAGDDGNYRSSNNYTKENLNLNNKYNNNNSSSDRTSNLAASRSLSLIKKDSKVTWILTANKTSRNDKLIDDGYGRNSSIDNDDENLAVLPLQEPIPTRFKLVLNRTKFIPSTNLNDDDNGNDRLLNKSADVEMRDDVAEPRLLATAASILQGVSESPRLSRARSAFPGDYQQDEQQEQRQDKTLESSFGNATSSAMDIAAVTGSCLAAIVLIGTMGSLGFVMYRRRYMNPPQTLNSDKCSNPDSSGYIDDSTIRDNSEEMYSLDNDSFLNSLEAMTIQNYWTDSVKHTKL